MNANEVIANRALEHLGHRRGEYRYCHPNNHVNLSQSTNDVYPTAVKIAIVFGSEKVVSVLESLIDAFRVKGREFAPLIKMGRTQLQDAVPMTLGQEFEAYATTLSEEIDRLRQNARLFLDVVLAHSLTVTLAAEAGQLELNVMEPVIVRSIGIVTELTPVLGYDICTELAQEALKTDRGVYELVLERKLLTRAELDRQPDRDL
jgi:aspartate ammonia-lyase